MDTTQSLNGKLRWRRRRRRIVIHIKTKCLDNNAVERRASHAHLVLKDDALDVGRDLRLDHLPPRTEIILDVGLFSFSM